MALFLTVFATCMLIFGGVALVLLLTRTPRYRTEPEHLLAVFDKALDNRVSETEWNTVIDYPIRHDEYMENVRRRARLLMDEHGWHGRLTRGKPLLDEEGRSELAALRQHLAARTRLKRDSQTR
ncbi:hypothetical protein OM427_18580 [Halomonas sp. 18H]|uniref:hypothetical protein n=1 Tax=Halomonas almeriensis TaxID=308163 RepID=UPI00222EE468|nr:MULTISPECIES: hypothetical protein [Halomonas]MCW4151535.1 hypothetical protein [Halomonas sp. 18H]MDN3552681.1 hypothetical protein [Halomonas almeriensis]